LISKYQILLFIPKLAAAFGCISQIVHTSFHLIIIEAVLHECAKLGIVLHISYIYFGIHTVLKKSEIVF
jgi:hypothetical protein